MRKILMLLLCCLLMSGCSSSHEELETVMRLRAALLSGMGCGFTAKITADYQDSIHTFSMDCSCDEYGNLEFTVTQPESISAVTGTISQEEGRLTFDDQALAFELLADGQVSPVCAPWLLIKTLRGGNIISCGKADDLIRASINDSFQDDALQLDIWFGEDGIPEYAEILWDNRRIVSMEVVDFKIL